MEKINPPKFDRVEEMSNLTYLNEPSVFNNLKQRYLSDRIYTKSGQFTIAINPYANLGIYGPEMIEAFEQTQPASQPPHIYAVALEAYNNMMFTGGRSQSILLERVANRSMYLPSFFNFINLCIAGFIS